MLPPVKPPVQHVPQGTWEDTLGPASVSPTEPEQGESTETPTVLNPPLQHLERYALPFLTLPNLVAQHESTLIPLQPASTVMMSSMDQTLELFTLQPSLH